MDKQPLPHSRKIEKDVLGAILFDPENMFNAVSRHVTAETFHYAEHRQIWQAMSLVYENKRALDYQTVSDALQNKEIEIVSYCEIHTDVGFSSWIEILLNYECRRKMIKAAQKIINSNFSDDKFSDTAETHIRECREILALSKKRESISTADLISKTIEMTGNINEHPDRYVAKYCIPGIDRFIKHRFKEFHVLGAPSGCGKTSFALSAMEKQINEGVKHILFCNETDAKTLMQRLICIHADIDFDRINTINDCAASNIIRVTDAVKYFNDLHRNFKIYGKGDYEHTLNGIAACLKEDADTGLEPHMVTVDYIQNLRPEGSLVKAPRHQQIEELIFGLSDIFAEFNVAGLALSQLNRDKSRDTASRDSINADLKGSSAIEQQADYVTFLKRKTVDNIGNIFIRWFSTKLRGSHEIAEDMEFNTGNGKFIRIVNKGGY